MSSQAADTLPDLPVEPEPTERTHFVEARDGQQLALTEFVGMGLDEQMPAPGAAPAFLLIHGFAQNRRAWTLGPMPAALRARGARVFLGELRGHGDSKVERKHMWTMEDHLDLDCPALIEGVQQLAGVERIHFVGHSMGGLLGSALLGSTVFDAAPPFESFTAAATPVLLGAHRPLVRLLSFFVGPLATIAPKSQRVPMDQFLRLLATPLARADAWGPTWALQKLTRLANPEQADADDLRRILEHADPESPAVLEALAANAVLGRSKIAGIDLAEALRESTCPIAAVVGTDDIFAPRAAIAPLETEGQQGPRKIIEIEGGTHIDAVMGHHVPGTVDRLWDFWMDEPGARDGV